MVRPWSDLCYPDSFAAGPPPHFTLAHRRHSADLLLRTAGSPCPASAGKRPLLELNGNAQPSVLGHGAHHITHRTPHAWLRTKAESLTCSNESSHGRAGHPAKKARAAEPENWTTATQSQPRNSSNVSPSMADALLRQLDSSARPGAQQASQACPAAVMAGARRDTQLDDDVEWSDDDDPQALLALVMDTQPVLEVGSPADGARLSGHGTSDEEAALLRSVEAEEVRRYCPSKASWLHRANPLQHVRLASLLS